MPALPATASALRQAGTGTITGQVLDLDNKPLANVHLSAFSQAQSTPNRTPLSQFQTDAQGRYSVQVPAGQIWIHFETQDINGQSWWGYDNLPVTVAAGQTVSGQDFRVAIRQVSEPPTAVPPTAVPPAATPEATVPAPGMPSSGAGPDLRLPLIAGLGLLLLLIGLVQRRVRS